MSTDENDDLATRIARAKSAQEKIEKSKKPDDSGAGANAGSMALRYGAEFGMAVFVGIMIGYWIDAAFGTEPWGLLIMMGFGLAAGVLSVIRAYKELTNATNPAMSPDKTGSNPEE
ncbi:MAG: AtpZ/AtpI family protein [Pseudomonadota bacterium]|jgi:ATP synthase protein I|nr:AtpZ/AtpI family protein [Pseudomonadota bacterium]